MRLSLTIKWCSEERDDIIMWVPCPPARPPLGCCDNVTDMPAALAVRREKIDQSLPIPCLSLNLTSPLLSLFAHAILHCYRKSPQSPTLTLPLVAPVLANQSGQWGQGITNHHSSAALLHLLRASGGELTVLKRHRQVRPLSVCVRAQT